MYTLERFVSNGKNAAFFIIKGHNRLGVLIRFSKNRADNVQGLQEEFRRGKFLLARGVPVPRYVGIVDVLIPNNINQLFMQNFPTFWDDNIIDIMRNNLQPGLVFDGLVIENIEEDISGKDSGARRQIYSEALNKVHALGIVPSDTDFDLNVLYAKNKVYFIDFGSWRIPSKLYFAINEKLLEEESIELVKAVEEIHKEKYRNTEEALFEIEADIGYIKTNVEGCRKIITKLKSMLQQGKVESQEYKAEKKYVEIRLQNMDKTTRLLEQILIRYKSFPTVNHKLSDSIDGHIKHFKAQHAQVEKEFLMIP